MKTLRSLISIRSCRNGRAMVPTPRVFMNVMLCCDWTHIHQEHLYINACEQRLDGLFQRPSFHRADIVA